MQRITEQQLKVVLNRMNLETGNPLCYAEPYEKGKPFRANIGNYHLDCCNGGYSVCQVMNEGGGIITIFHRGTKREIYLQIHAWLDGHESKRVQL